MNDQVAVLNQAIRSFVSGGDYMTLWRAVMDSTESIDPERDLDHSSRDLYAEIYDLVYMGQSGEPGKQALDVGIVGEVELRRRLDAVQLRSND
jgi:hypothetical protein